MSCPAWHVRIQAAHAPLSPTKPHVAQLYQCCSTNAPLVDANVHFVGTSRCGSSSSSWTGRVCSSCLNPRARRKPAQRAAASSNALALPSVLPDCTKRCATSAAALPPFVTAHKTSNDSQGLDARAGSSSNSQTSPSSTIARRIAVLQAEAQTSFPFLAVFWGAQPASSSPLPATNDAAPVAAGYLPSTPFASPHAALAQSSQIDAVSCFAATSEARRAPGGAPLIAFAVGNRTLPDVASGNWEAVTTIRAAMARWPPCDDKSSFSAQLNNFSAPTLSSDVFST
mmetsp:Transcript_17661/g.50456  ORF Transcript_17661/g.50456 Transcript_17661/m.50456 type:complete len:284 (+) Transcript_17661:3112-3963(+)